MIEQFLSHINQNQLFDKEDTILLAVSGGIDSMVMAALFQEAKLNFALAHCNFGLRGEDSDADEQFVKKIAKRYKVPFFVNHFDTETYAKSEQLSIQMAARYLRYQWFEELRQQEGFAYVATAHHQNDTLETVLFNLTKGTGIAGLHGILPKKGNIIRPILFADKEMIYDYTASRQLVWREDSSNESVRYHRNLIRNQVVPVLKQINPEVETTFAQSVERIRAVEQVFYEKVKQAEEEIVKQEGLDVFLDIEKLQQLREPAIILHELLRPYNFNYTQAKEIIERLDKGSGKWFMSATHRLNIDRTLLIISPKELEVFQDRTIEFDTENFENEFFKLNFSVEDAAGFNISKDKDTAALDFDKLQFPVKIRKWKDGDWFHPLGMNRKKKLSDFMVDEKIPVTLKERVFVLTSGGSIAWVIGHRIDDRFKISNKTEKIYKVEIV